MGGSFSVVIRDFDILRLVFLPAKTNSILIVNADTVLAGSISRKFFEPQTGNAPEVCEVLCISEEGEFDSGDLLYLLKPLDADTFREPHGFLVPKGHLPIW